MATLEDLRKRLLLQKEAIEETKQKKGKKSYTITEEDRAKKKERFAPGNPFREKMDAARAESVAKRRAAKEELKETLRQEALEKLRSKIQKEVEVEAEVEQKPSSLATEPQKPKKKKLQGTSIRDKVDALTEVLSKVPERENEAVMGLKEQISKLESKISEMAVKPVIQEEPPKPVVQEVVEEKPKIRYFLGDEPKKRRKGFYDPFGIVY